MKTNLIFKENELLEFSDIIQTNDNDNLIIKHICNISDNLYDFIKKKQIKVLNVYLIF